MRIGTETFAGWSGVIRPAEEVLQEITRPNIDGHDYRKLGERGPLSEIITTAIVADGETAKTTIEAYAALKTQIVEVEDQHESLWTSVMVLGIEILLSKAVAACAGTYAEATGVMIVARWTLQVQPD